MPRNLHPRALMTDKRKRPTDDEARPAVLCLNSWAGYSEQSVLVVSETPQRYRIEAGATRVKLGGRQRWLDVGQRTLVPKSAVRMLDPDDCVNCQNPRSHHRSIEGVLMCCESDGTSLTGGFYRAAARSLRDRVLGETTS